MNFRIIQVDTNTGNESHGITYETEQQAIDAVNELQRVTLKNGFDRFQYLYQPEE